MLHSSFAVICNLICVTRRDEHVQETKSPVRFGPLLGFAHTLFGDVDQVIRRPPEAPLPDCPDFSRFEGEI